MEESIDRSKLVYKTDSNTFDFRKFNTVRTFGKDIYNGKITLEEVDESQSDLLNETKTFNEKTRPKYSGAGKWKILPSIMWIIYMKQGNGP